MHGDASFDPSRSLQRGNSFGLAPPAEILGFYFLHWGSPSSGSVLIRVAIVDLERRQWRETSIRSMIPNFACYAAPLGDAGRNAWRLPMERHQSAMLPRQCRLGSPSLR